jgi:hypothetical protein
VAFEKVCWRITASIHLPACSVRRHYIVVIDAVELLRFVPLIGPISARLGIICTCNSKKFRASSISTYRLDAPNTAPLAGNRPICTFTLCNKATTFATIGPRYSATQHPSRRRRLLVNARQRLPAARKAGQEEAPAVCAKVAEAVTW